MAHLAAHLYEEGDENPQNIVEPAQDVFEIDDFTCPSDWEKFVARVEQLIREWGLGVDQKPATPSHEEWAQESASVIFYDFHFQVTRFHRKIETQGDPGVKVHPVFHSMMSSKDDFPAQSHPIHYFYGLDDFVVFSPKIPNEPENIDNETRANLVLSTIAVAIHNTNCRVPVFVQVMERQKSTFSGVGAFGNPLSGSKTFRTDFRMILLQRKPPDCHHLSGLLKLFKSKINPDLSIDIPGVRVTARISYALEDWTFYIWTQLPPDPDIFNDMKLPFGSTKDPIRRLILHTTWKDLQEEIITDNDVHSDLDPMDAPGWSVSVQFDDKPDCLLINYLGEMSRLCKNTESVRQILGNLVDQDEDDQLENLPNALHKITGPSYTIKDIIQSGRSSKKGENGGPIPNDILTRLLEFLFPDVDDHSRFPYKNDFCETLRGIKSCPEDGLVWRLTIALSHCHQVLGGIRPFAHLMHEFLLEVRFRWESGKPLPGLPKGQPDQTYCLLHQKLQMVNCCIERKISRERQPSVHEEKADSSEDEFFECNEEEEEEEFFPAWDEEAKGRLSRCGKLKLLEVDEYIYVPICQDPTPMTEDMLAEQAEVMLQLGMDAEGSALRAKMQSASLLSDMESFKAANPGSTLGDFVRWHSPRDWEESSDGKGQLSARMKSEGNVWQEVWSNAKPVPARRQKRLFDDTKEAEKVIQYLTSQKPSDVSLMLLPTLLHVAVSRIMEEKFDGIPDVSDILNDAVRKLSSASRHRCFPEVRHYAVQDQLAELEEEFAKRAVSIQEVTNLLRLAELKISRAFSLQSKFIKNFVKDQVEEAEPGDEGKVREHTSEFVQNLYSQPEVKVLGAGRGPTGQLVCKMFRDAKRARDMVLEADDEEHVFDKDIFPRPLSKEFILRTWVGRPYPYSQAGPQRLYCCLKDNEFRVAGAFTIDKQFL